MPLMVSKELQTEDALSGFREATDRGCPFWFFRSYRWKIPLMVSKELQTEDALPGFREATDGGCPF